MFKTQKLILLGLLFFSAMFLASAFANASQAKQIKIVTSISPIASVFATIAGDSASVSSICINNQCPAHYLAKPSQLKQIVTADLLVYIDDAFEVFMQKPLQETKALILKLSNNPSLVTKYNNQTNWHLWLGIDNLKAMMDQALLVLSKLEPENSKIYERNYKEAYQSLESLQVKMRANLSKLEKPILLDDSLEYFFANFKSNDEVFRLYNRARATSFAKLEQLKEHASKTRAKCAFASTHQDLARLRDFFQGDLRVIALESESWQDPAPYEGLMQIKLQIMMDLVLSCL